MYALFSQNAGTYLPGTPVVEKRAETREELEPLKDALKTTNGPNGSMVFWIEKVK